MPLAAPRRRFAVLCTLLMTALAVAAGPTQAADLEAYRALEATTRATCERILPAVVGLSSSEAAKGRRGVLGMGSGVLVSEDGLILTAGHVVGKPGSTMKVYLTDGRVVPAVGLGVDHTRDAGMARITEPGRYPFVEVGRSRDVQPGDWCLAAGHPGGIHRGRTPPVRLGRLLGVHDGQVLYMGLISDATVISGDSGGPLFDRDGRVIGIHSNIGLGVNENRHVPVDVFRDQWDALLAGEVTGKPVPDAALSREAAKAGGAEAADGEEGAPFEMPDLARFQQMLQERLKRGDAEVLEMAKKGQLALTPEKIGRLMEKWEAEDAAAPDDTGAPAGEAASDTDTAEATDADAAGAGPAEAAEGPSPEGDDAEDAAPGAASSEAAVPSGETPATPAVPGLDLEALQKLLRHAKRGKDGRYTVEVGPDELEDLMPLIRKVMQQGGQGMAGVFGDLKHAKSDASLLADFEPLTAGAAPSVVTVLEGDEPVACGVVVRADGYILTKASELGEAPACRVGTCTLPARLVAKDEAWDLGLLKVEGQGLAPMAWAADADLAVGTWLVTPDAQGKPLALGMVGVGARRVPASPQMAFAGNHAAVGVALDPEKPAAVVKAVVKGSPAAKAGLKVGDVIRSIDGRRVRRRAALQRAVRARKPGDTVTLGVRRGRGKAGANREVSVTLGSMQDLANPEGNPAEATLGLLSTLGGMEPSERHTDFPQALTHDAALVAAQCGGPVLGLDGRAVGLTLARADRTACYAVPAKALVPVIERLLAEAKARQG